MKTTRITALAAVGLVATLSLTACGNDSGKDTSSKGSSASSAPTDSSSASSSADGGAPSQGGSGSGGSAAGQSASSSGGSGKSGSGGTGGGTATGGKVTFCRTANLAIDAVDASPDKVSGRIDITMVNRGSTTCSATGFAGVDIKDADHTSSPVDRGHAEPRITVLKPGDAAVFDIAYDIDSSGKSLTSPTDILVTPPNETHTVDLKWPAGAKPVKGSYIGVQVFPTHNK
ncbi:DUF4232 domain-containing protein [Streptomyces sp. SID8366]|uniref:DUF4232 domain-containing protein n=1 Tax=unclassified Streptomyces TaxID=2593676 RepID=UPI000DB9B88F|nr:DUF4232 domain-containing protein [Streptomyces sp. PsTaAH-130]MYU02511.1 DUF4232 domain-containing protein [Streptomyces sp. SID8366]MYU62142.1 DUF4232 domain-containing protein [Streptomyces sp. SID69]RAJ55342.1 uncharacterized protein DUF4232 [Streptomyces sp. PsTaAH-130]